MQLMFFKRLFLTIVFSTGHFKKKKDFTIAHPDDLCFESGDDTSSTTGSIVDTLSELSSKTDSSSAKTVEPQTQADITLQRFQKQNLFWEKQSEAAPPPKSEAQLLASSLMLKKPMGTPPTNTNHKKETNTPSRELPLHATWFTPKNPILILYICKHLFEPCFEDSKY